MCAKEIVSFELKRHVYNATVKLVYHFTFQYFFGGRISLFQAIYYTDQGEKQL